MFSIPLRNKMIEYEIFGCKHNQTDRIIASAIRYKH